MAMNLGVATSYGVPSALPNSVGTPAEAAPDAASATGVATSPVAAEPGISQDVLSLSSSNAAASNQPDATPPPALKPMPSLRRVEKKDAHFTAPQVKTLQKLLTQAGFNPGPVDGWFGPVTEGAVKRFQAAKGLPADGVVNDAMWAALGNPPPNVSNPGTVVTPVPPTANPNIEPPKGSPFDRRYDWYISQYPSKWNPKEDVRRNGNCGPTSATMVARAFGAINITPEQADAAIEEMRLRMHSGTNEHKGTSIHAIVMGLESYGLHARTRYNITIQNIANELAKGRLVINWIPGHYHVVTAVKNGRVYLNDPAKWGPTSVPIEEYMQTMSSTHTCISVEPPKPQAAQPNPTSA